jgi:hypothetical protein
MNKKENEYETHTVFDFGACARYGAFDVGGLYVIAAR